MTIERTVGDDIVQTVTLPSGGSDGVVDTAAMSVDASDVLTLTLGRTVGADVTATVTLPDTGSPSTVLPRFRAPLATKTVASRTYGYHSPECDGRLRLARYLRTEGFTLSNAEDSLYV